MGTFLIEAYALPIMLCVPLLVALLLMRRWFFAHNYWQVGLQIIISLVPYGLGIAWAIWTGRVWKVDGLSVRKESDEVDAALIETYQQEP